MLCNRAYSLLSGLQCKINSFLDLFHFTSIDNGELFLQRKAHFIVYFQPFSDFYSTFSAEFVRFVHGAEATFYPNYIRFNGIYLILYRIQRHKPQLIALRKKMCCIFEIS